MRRISDEIDRQRRGKDKQKDIYSGQTLLKHGKQLLVIGVPTKKPTETAVGEMPKSVSRLETLLSPDKTLLRDSQGYVWGTKNNLGKALRTWRKLRGMWPFAI